jgi:hypothetical protein
VKKRTPHMLVSLALAAAFGAAGCASGERSGNGVGERALGFSEGEDPPPPFPTAKGPGTRYALVVGVSQYEDARIPRLRFAKRDAEAVWAAFVSDTGLAIKPQNARLLVDGEAKRADIEKGLLWLNSVAGPADTVIVYFAGHGAVDIGSNGVLKENYLLPQDARARGESERVALDTRTGLSLERLEDLLGRNRAGNLLLVLDACFAGGAKGNFSKTRLEPGQLDDGKKRLESIGENATGWSVLSATLPGQPALEMEEYGHGLFTYYFLEGLKNDANRDGFVTLPEVRAYLQPRVRDEAQRRGYRQEPLLRESRSEELKLCVLARAGFKIGLEVSYGGSTPTIKGRSEAPEFPERIEAPAQWSVEVNGWAQVPVEVYVLRVVRSAGGVRTARLLPDGENLLAPSVSVAEGQRALYPNERAVRTSFAPVAPEEREASVCFVLIATGRQVARSLVDDLERRVEEAAAAAPAEELARVTARVVEGDPAFKDAALSYCFVRHSRGR